MAQSATDRGDGLSSVFRLEASPNTLRSRMPDMRAMGVRDFDFPLTLDDGHQLVRMTEAVLDKFMQTFGSSVRCVFER